MQHDTHSFADALHSAIDAVNIKKETKTVLLDEALGKVIAEDITAQKNLPSFDNSAMDGYAFRYEDVGKRVRVAKTIFAGEVPQATLQAKECYKIMTGAQVPSDADTIAPFEKCSEITDDEVTLPSDIKKGANLRKKGEETSVGKPLITKGTLLEASHIALLAAQGIVALKVFLPIKIAVLSSGNEIKEPWEVASEDEIYNANAFGITSLLRSFGFDAVYVGSMPDDYETTLAYLKSVKSYDVILTTGGISKGEHDYIYKAFCDCGLKTIFHGVALKPGHPTMMGKMGDVFVMGLPGNPLTTMVVTHSLALPVLYALQGSNRCHHTAVKATISQELRFRGKRTHIVLGNVHNGVFTPTRGGKVGSGMLTPLCESNAVAYFQEGFQKVEEAQSVKVVMLQDTTRSETFEVMN